MSAVFTSMNELSPLIMGLIESGTDVEIVVTGDSMSPLFKHRRDTVVLTKCDPLQLKRGQIPLYRRKSDNYVLHRICRKEVETFDAVGDAQYSVEKDIPLSSVLCVVKSFKRKGKYHSTNDFSFRLYSSLWLALLPFRKYFFAVWRKMRHISEKQKKHP